MSTITLPRATPGKTPTPHFLDGLAQRAVRDRLSGIRHGRITLHDGGTQHHYGAHAAHCPLEAALHVHDARFWSELAFGGSIGAGEASPGRRP